MSFLLKLSKSPNLLLRQIYEYSGHEDINRLSKVFNSDNDNFVVVV